MLALLCSALSLAPTAPLARPTVSRASTPAMQLTKKVRRSNGARTTHLATSLVWRLPTPPAWRYLHLPGAVGSWPCLSLLERSTPTAVQVVSFDQDGLFEGREISVAKPPVRLLERVEELRLLSSVADAGLLSGAEEAGVFSKLEAAGAFSTAEKLLPLGAIQAAASRHFPVSSLLLCISAWSASLTLPCVSLLSR